MSAPQGARFHRGDAHRKRGQWRRDLVQLHDATCALGERWLYGVRLTTWHGARLLDRRGR